MMKKGLLGILVVILVLGVGQYGLAAQIELELWYGLGGTPGEALRELVDMFNASQSEIKVTAHYQGNYFDTQQKLIAAVSAGVVPDVVNLEVTAVVPFAVAGQLVNLEEYIDEDYDLDDIFPGLLADGYVSGRLYALPFARSTPVLYYKKDLFEQTGLPQRAPETWDEFAEWIKILDDLDQGDSSNPIYGFSHNNDTWSFEYMILSHGGLISDENYNWHFATDENSIGAIERFREFFAPGSGGRFVLRSGEVDAGIDFTTGRAAMVIQSTGVLTNLANAVEDRFEYGVGFVPMGTQRAVATGGNSFVIMKNISSEKKEAAWKFLKFMTSTEQAAWLSLKTGYMPLRQSSAALPVMQERFAQDPNFETAVKQLPYAVPQATYMHIPRGSAIIQEALVRIMLEGQPVREALRQAAEELTREARRGGFTR